jgi:hypothetical protein
MKAVPLDAIMAGGTWDNLIDRKDAQVFSEGAQGTQTKSGPEGPLC